MKKEMQSLVDFMLNSGKDTTIGCWRSIGQTIDDLRSDKATAHGKLGEEYVVDEPLWAALAVNTCATVGIFLWELFNKKYKLVEDVSQDTISELPDETIDQHKECDF